MASLRDLGSMNGTHVTGKFPYRFDPKRDPIDIIAVAARHGIDYLLTWNCKHIANAEIIRRLDQVIRDAGYLAPTICTPTELFGGQEHE